MSRICLLFGQKLSRTAIFSQKISKVQGSQAESSCDGLSSCYCVEITGRMPLSHRSKVMPAQDIRGWDPGTTLCRPRKALLASRSPARQLPVPPCYGRAGTKYYHQERSIPHLRAPRTVDSPRVQITKGQPANTSHLSSGSWPVDIKAVTSPSTPRANVQRP